MCHGAQGKGNGSAVEFTEKTVPDLTTQRIKRQSDADLFNRITAGAEPMPEFGDFMTREDVWKIIHYLRILGADHS